MKVKFPTPVDQGMHELINEKNSSLEVLKLAVLNMAADAVESLSTADEEVCCIPVKGTATLQVDCKSYVLDKGDCLYIPRRKTVEVAAGADAAQIVICRAPADEDTEVIYTRLADAWKHETLHQHHGKYSFARDVIDLVPRDAKARRLVAGITYGQDGQWTSWPPHHHSESMEEIYYYFDIPENGFGVHIGLFMDGTEQAEIVRSGDAAIVPDGYHPTVATPGSRMTYIWFLGAKRTEEDRRAKVTNHPHYC